MGGQGLERKTNLTENTQKIKSESASDINMGGGAQRQFSGQEHLMLLQRTQVQLSAPIPGLTNVSNSSSW